MPTGQIFCLWTEMIRKRTRRAPARPRKKSRTTRVPRQVKSTNLMMCTRVADGGSFTMNANGAWTAINFGFALSNLVNYTEFTSLFNQYRINAVKVMVMPHFDGNDMSNINADGTSGVGRPANPILWTCSEDDGTTTVVNLNAVMQNNRARLVKRPNLPFSVYFKPKFQTSVANIGSIVSAHPMRGWIDTQNFGVQHYGISLAGYIPAASSISTPPLTYKIFVKYYMAFKEAI